MYFLESATRTVVKGQVGILYISSNMQAFERNILWTLKSNVKLVLGTVQERAVLRLTCIFMRGQDLVNGGARFQVSPCPYFESLVFLPIKNISRQRHLTHLPLISINVNIVVFMQAVFAYKRLDICI